MLRGEAGAAAARSLIAEGDLVIAYESWDSMRAVRIARDSSFNNKYGTFQLQSWIGQPYGARISASGGSGGWVVALRPTPELWTAVLRHRTQILYVADISLAIALMELRPGSMVLESGTGSGSMTTSIARTVAPHGHVHTFEFHQQRAALAAREFVDNGLGGLVTVEHRNVEADGFPAALAGTADAVFLDLPAPWRVVPATAKCLRSDGVACTFSPCIEQVQRTCKELNAHGFRNLRTMEVLLRQYDVLTEQQLTDESSLLVHQLPATACSEGLDGCGVKRQRTGSPPTSPTPSLALTDLPTQGEAVVAGVADIASIERQLQEILKPPSEADFLQEFLAIQNQQPRNIGFFGTRNMGFMHQQLIEVLAYAMVLTGNHIFTSGATGTNAAVIRGALRAEAPELLTVVLPQSLQKQPSESQELLQQVQNVVEMPANDGLQLIEASRICNRDIIGRVQQVICFAFHDSSLLLETCREARSESKIVTLFYLD